jgi:hypothetical protein
MYAFAGEVSGGEAEVEEVGDRVEEEQAELALGITRLRLCLGQICLKFSRLEIRQRSK